MINRENRYTIQVLKNIAEASNAIADSYRVSGDEPRHVTDFYNESSYKDITDTLEDTELYQHILLNQNDRLLLDLWRLDSLLYEFTRLDTDKSVIELRVTDLDKIRRLCYKHSSYSITDGLAYIKKLGLKTKLMLLNYYIFICTDRAYERAVYYQI